MPTISQEGVRTLVAGVNAANEAIASAINAQTSSFANNLKEIWESPQAHEFAVRVDECINTIWGSYRARITDLYDVLKTNVNNHNINNSDSVVMPELTMPEASSKIGSVVLDHFADGANGDEKGIRTGRDPKEAKVEFTSLATSLKEAADSAIKKAQTANAFGSSEGEAVVNAVNTFMSKFNTHMEALNEQLNKSLGVASENATNLETTNAQNLKQ